MKTCIATVSICRNLDEKIEAIATAGFYGIEILEQDVIADALAPRRGLHQSVRQPWPPCCSSRFGISRV